MARRHSRGFVRPQPRTKIWIGAGVGQQTIVASSVQLLASLSAGALLLRPFTILRTHMLIAFSSDQAAVTEVPQGTFARIVVTETASAVGATAVPDPSNIDGDPDAGWFLSKDVFVKFQFLDATGFEGDSSTQYEVDSKAMRKVGPDDDVVSMFSETAGQGAQIVTRGRMLIQLH